LSEFEQHKNRRFMSWLRHQNHRADGVGILSVAIRREISVTEEPDDGSVYLGDVCRFIDDNIKQYSGPEPLTSGRILGRAWDEWRIWLQEQPNGK
jgi:hypothetical protein